MSQTITATQGADVIDALLGIPPEGRLDGLRKGRAEARHHTQASYDALFAPNDPGNLTLIERFGVALRVAALNQEPALVQHYSERLESLGTVSSPAETVQLGEAVAPGKLTVILRHTDRVTREPQQARSDHIEGLLGAGLQPRDIVVLLQVIAFVNFQARLIAGLRLLQEAQ